MWHVIKAALLLAPRIIYSYFAWMISYAKAKNRDKIPVQKRYKKTRKLIHKVNKALKLDIENFSKEILEYPDFVNDNNLIIVCPTCHKEIHLKDNPELSQYLQKY